ncbi:MAG: ATP-dependent DNA ligase [Nanoarchaeota archaeon]
MLYLQLCETYEELEKNPSRIKKTSILSDFLAKLKNSNQSEIIYLIQGNVFPDYSEKEFGISEKLAIKSLSKASGVSDKLIIEKWKKLGDLGQVAEEIMKNKKQGILFSHPLTVRKVLENLKKLPELEGKGTIEKKLSLISELLTSATSKEAKYLIRTLLQNLRIGVAEGVLRDSIVDACFNKEKLEKEEIKKIIDSVQEAYDKSTDWKLVFEEACKGLSYLEKTSLEPGKPVKVMLFLKEDTIEKGFERVGRPCLIDFKYDGFRVMINKDEKGNIKIFTRRLDNVTAQFPDIVEFAKKYVKAGTFILDAEAVGFDPKTKAYQPFQVISQRIKRKYYIEKLAKELPIEINVFDIIYYNGKSLLKEPYKERRKIIEKIITTSNYKIKASEAIITDNIKEAENFYKKAIVAGEEGIMMKNLEAPYKPGARIGYGIKIKPEENEFDLVIIKAEYGTGKRAGWLTSYTLACRDKNKFLEIGKVSTGLKEKVELGLSFKELTKKLKSLIIKESGREVEVKPKLVVTIVYQNIQSSPTYNSGYALRFPRITRLRLDRSTLDITTLNEVKREFEMLKR